MLMASCIPLQPGRSFGQFAADSTNQTDIEANAIGFREDLFTLYCQAIIATQKLERAIAVAHPNLVRDTGAALAAPLPPQRMPSDTTHTSGTVSDDDFDEIMKGQCIGCDRIGPLGTYCGWCEDTGFIFVSDDY
jgi:hypothetical protein